MTSLANSRKSKKKQIGAFSACQIGPALPWSGRMQNVTTATATPAAIPAGSILKVGDPVTHRIYTDANAATVIKVSPNGRTVIVRYCEQKLLNGANSGHPEALTFTPGGFCGHTEGNQIWEVKDNPEGGTAKFTLRKVGAFWTWKLAGSRNREPGNTLKPGHHPHYDFNF